MTDAYITDQQPTRDAEQTRRAALKQQLTGGTTMEARDIFLTEAMGIRVYDRKENPEYYGAQCERAVCRIDDFVCESPDFSTWAGFGKLWTWAKEQDWWIEFVPSIMSRSIKPNSGYFFLPTAYIDPDRFADEVFEYLQGV